MEPYKEGLNKPVSDGGWGIKKFNLDDLYVRFFRLAERRIAEMTGKGVVSFISNHSWISEPSFVVLRKHLLDSFDRFWIENLHGNRKISEYAPDGRTSETVFAIRRASPSAFSKELPRRFGSRPASLASAVNRRAYFSATTSTPPRLRSVASSCLGHCSGRDLTLCYVQAMPDKESRYSFRPSPRLPSTISNGRAIVDLCALPPNNGLMEKRGGALIDIDREELATRMKAYFNKRYDWQEYSLTVER